MSMVDCRGGQKMKLGSVCVLVGLAVIVGCGIWAVKRAPVESVPEDADPEVKMQMLEDMKAEYPDDPNLYFTLGNVYYDELMLDDARSNFEKAIDLDPKFNKARVNLATLLMEIDEVDSARSLLEEAIGIDEKDVKAYTNLGLLYYSESDLAKAVKYFARALEIDSTCVEAHYNLGFAFAESGLLLEAIREWRKVIDLEPEGEIAEQARMSLERTEKLLKQ